MKVIREYFFFYLLLHTLKRILTYARTGDNTPAQDRQVCKAIIIPDARHCKSQKTHLKMRLIHFVESF